MARNNLSILGEISCFFLKRQNGQKSFFAEFQLLTIFPIIKNKNTSCSHAMCTLTYLNALAK